MAKQPTPPDQAGKEAITDEQQPQKKGKLAGILPMVLGVALMAGMAWAFTELVLVKSIERKLEGVLAQPSAKEDGGKKEATEGEHSEDGSHKSSDGDTSKDKSDHSNATKSHDSSSSAHEGSGEDTKDKPFEGPYKIESALVNIKDTKASRFLVVSIIIDSGNDTQRLPLYDTLKNKDPFIRDMAQTILSGFSMEDLADEPAAKNRAKIQMMTELESYITDKKLKYSVLFTQWAIQ